MAKIEKIKSNIIGLDMGLALGRFFLNTEDLHFGYWPNNEKPTVKNFSWAQENHSQLIMDNIPSGVKKILDVGSGSGSLALEIVASNFLYGNLLIVDTGYYSDRLALLAKNAKKSFNKIKKI